MDHVTFNSGRRTAVLYTGPGTSGWRYWKQPHADSWLRLKLRNLPKESARRKLDLDTLKDQETQREVSLRLQNRFLKLLGGRNRDETDIWQSIKNIEMETGRKIWGYSNRKRRVDLSDTYMDSSWRKERAVKRYPPQFSRGSSEKILNKR